MNIIIPMAGLGSRFSQSGFVLPKPLIDVAGKPMYQHAVDCLPLHLAKKLVFILRKNEYSDLIVDDIQTQYGSKYACSIIILEQETEGQAETVLKGLEKIDFHYPSLVHNCDTCISSIKWENILHSHYEGAIVAFKIKEYEERWSYIQLNDNQDCVIDMREKQVISSYASTGTYYFKNSQKLRENLEFMISNNFRENNEYYLSTLYRIMIQQHQKIAPLWTDEIRCFGTPQDLVHSLNQMILKLQQGVSVQ